MKENYTKSEQISRVHTKFQSSITPQKNNDQKIFLILNSTLDQFLMIQLTFLCNEYIDRPKLSEQKNHLSI